MPHGDFSDVAAFGCAIVGIASIADPMLWYKTYGAVKPMFDLPEGTTPAADTLAVIRFAGGLLLFMFPVLYVVRWNTLNGKAGALGSLIAAGNAARISWSMDGGVFVLRGWYLLAGFLVMTALHLAFNANPCASHMCRNQPVPIALPELPCPKHSCVWTRLGRMLTSAMLLEKEKAKAAKAAAKAPARPSRSKSPAKKK